MSYVSLHELSPSTIKPQTGNRILRYVQPVGLLLNIAVLFGLLYTTVTDEWAENEAVHFGLWHICRTDENFEGSRNCTHYNPTPAHIHACRVFMILSCLLATSSLLCAGHGLLSKDSRKFYVASGILCAAAIFSVISTVTFTVCNVHDYTITSGVVVALVMVPVALSSVALYLCGCSHLRNRLPLLGNGNYKDYGCIYSKYGLGAQMNLGKV